MLVDKGTVSRICTALNIGTPRSRSPIHNVLLRLSVLSPRQIRAIHMYLNMVKEADNDLSRLSKIRVHVPRAMRGAESGQADSGLPVSASYENSAADRGEADAASSRPEGQAQ